MRKRNSREANQPGLFPTACQKPEAPAGGLTVYCDGACIPNPGGAGWGFVAYSDGLEVDQDFGGIDSATNNVAELTALLRAVEWVSENHPTVAATIISDSKYVVDGCNVWRHSWRAKGWKRKSADAMPANQAIANLDLWQSIDAALTENPLISIAWCKGHSGIPGNLRADELASIGWASIDRSDSNFGLALDQQYRSIMGGSSWI